MRAILVAAVLASAAPAAAQCHFRYEYSVGCTLSGTPGTSAVAYYRMLGGDKAKIDPSNVRVILARNGCIVIQNIGGKLQPKQVSHGRVAMLDGWAGVTTISMIAHDGQNWVLAVADEYLVGKCEPDAL